MTNLASPRLDTEASAGEPGPPARSSPSRGIWLNVLIIVGLLVMVLPFVWMVLGSFKTTAELRQLPPTWIPENPTTENYRELFTRLDFPRYFLNSTVVAVGITLGNIVIGSMCGYALAKLDFWGKRALFLLVLGTLLVPGVVLFLPQFVLISNLGLVNTHLGLIFPFLAGPLGVFLMRQFMLSIPDDLIQAARVDGAGEYRIFARVVMPLCGPALATLGILTFLAAWNGFLWPLVVATTEDLYTLPVALALFAIGQQETNYGLLMAGSLVVILPVLILFVFLQRHFTAGIAMTGIK
jgi:multiple sugar transport system permease protein